VLDVRWILRQGLKPEAETRLRFRSRKPGAGGGRHFNIGRLSKLNESFQLVNNGVLLVFGQLTNYFDRLGQGLGHARIIAPYEGKREEAIHLEKGRRQNMA
jgi:hypothetical protein